MSTSSLAEAVAPPRIEATFPRAAFAALIASGLAAGIWWLSDQPGGSKLSLSLVFGSLFGLALQRSRFCFACHWRDLLDRGDPRGILAIILALAVGVAGTTAVVGAWLPNPAGTRLPPEAHIGPVSWVLVIAGGAFGAGMAISGSCISAHLYRLGEGSPTAPFALLGTAAGFVAGFWSWNPLYLATLSDAPVLWLPRHLGYGGALLLSLAVLAALSLWLLRPSRAGNLRGDDFSQLPHAEVAAEGGPRSTHGRSASFEAGLRPAPQDEEAGSFRPGSQDEEGGHVPLGSPLHAVFVERWPAWTGGLAVGALATIAYLRVGPLGVTAEIGSRSRQAATALDLLPARLEGLDAFRGCATLVRETLLTPNGLFILGLVLASLGAAVLAGQFKPEVPRAGQVSRGLLGGLLLGWGAMTGLGCSVGTLISGISAGAVSGWVFAAAMFAGAAATTALGRRAGLLPGAA